MMPNETRGRSFKGVLAYVLHDKREEGEAVRASSERVTFVELANLPTDDPENAYKLMAWTALHQGYLKELTGQSRRGRKAERPVWHVSLSWHPDEQEIDATAQAAAARDLLARFGLSEHQAVIAGHEDAEKGQAHLHIVANLINPLTGKMPEGGLSHSQKALQGWALQYEKEHGQSFCLKREKRAGEFDAALEKIEAAAERNGARSKEAQSKFEEALSTLDYTAKDDFAGRWQASAADTRAQADELAAYEREQQARREKAKAREREERERQKAGDRQGGARSGGGKGGDDARARAFTERQQKTAALKAEQAERKRALRIAQEAEREREDAERRKRARAALDENFQRYKPQFKALYDEKRAATWDIEKAIRRQKNLALELLPDWARGMAGAVIDPAIRKLHERPRKEVEKEHEARIAALKAEQAASRAKLIEDIRAREKIERQAFYKKLGDQRAALGQRHKAEWDQYFKENGIAEKARPNWQRARFAKESAAAESLKTINATRDRDAAKAAERAQSALRAAYGMATHAPASAAGQGESLKGKFAAHARAEADTLRAQFAQRAGQSQGMGAKLS